MGLFILLFFAIFVMGAWASWSASLSALRGAKGRGALHAFSSIGFATAAAACGLVSLATPLLILHFVG
jgi:hypothetical protein